MPNGFFGQYLQKMFKTEKKEHQHRILQGSSLGSKFHLQHTSLVF